MTKENETQPIIFPHHFKCERKQGKYSEANNYLTAINYYYSHSFMFRHATYFQNLELTCIFDI